MDEMQSRSSGTWVALLTSAIGAAAIIVAAIIGVDAKHDREVAASQISHLQEQLQQSPATQNGSAELSRQIASLRAELSAKELEIQRLRSGVNAPAPTNVATLPMVVRENGFMIELQSCSLKGDELECKLLASAEKEDASFRLNSWSRLVEGDGTEMLASRIQLGKSEARGQSQSVQADLVRGVPVKMSVGFVGLNTAVSSKEVRLIDLSVSGGPAQFQHVPVN
jgi:cell division protein FtsB